MPTITFGEHGYNIFYTFLAFCGDNKVPIKNKKKMY
jgi:hypothetical protein